MIGLMTGIGIIAAFGLFLAFVAHKSKEGERDRFRRRNVALERRQRLR